MAEQQLSHLQMRHIQNKDLGFKKEQVVLVHDAFALGNRLPAFKNALTEQPTVVSSSVTSYLPVASDRRDTGFWREGQATEEQAVSMQIWTVDHDYVRAMGMEIINGRDFSQAFASDSAAVILNERAAQAFGYEHPIGRKIYILGWSPEKGMDPTRKIPFTIIGVVKDFHFKPIHTRIEPLVLVISEQIYNVMVLRHRPENLSETVAFIESVCRKFNPETPYSLGFLDERYDALYRTEQRVGQLSSCFAAIAIFIASLGLYGLASYVAEQRTKA